jgi:hypothetical protein
VVDHEREQRGVDRGVAQPAERRSQVVDVQLCAVAHTRPREVDHPCAAVEADHSRAAFQQLLGVEAGAAARVEHRQAGHVPQQLQHRRAVVERVVGAGGCVALVLRSPLLVDRAHRADHRRSRAAIPERRVTCLDN